MTNALDTVAMTEADCFAREELVELVEKLKEEVNDLLVKHDELARLLRTTNARLHATLHVEYSTAKAENEPAYVKEVKSSLLKRIFRPF